MMESESMEFEKEGLKMDRERVLTYSKLNCPLDCRYCFVDDLNSGQNKDVAYLSEKQWQLIKQLPDEIKLIMLGCDTEFFQNKNEAIETLKKLVDLGKDISVITKFSLNDNLINELGEINTQLNAKGNLLAFSISLPCFDSAHFWEPKAPAPEKRIETLMRAKAVGLKTMVALRPLLPNVSDDELEKIILSTKDYSDGYYSGPLYLKEFNESIRADLKIEECDAKPIQPHWMPDGNMFYQFVKPGQNDSLVRILNKYNKPLFEGAAEGIEYFKSQR